MLSVIATRSDEIHNASLPVCVFTGSVFDYMKFSTSAAAVSIACLTSR
ncbi:hypothetical protein [Salmonella enterica subsp. enterica serovar Kentucky]|nr:hypothetical protein [Salmonella enterica subsp. enterica serovar Kentucky]